MHRNSFISGSTAAYSQNCWPLILITVSSSATQFGFAPLAGCSPAFCTQSLTAFHDRSTPNLSNLETVFKNHGPAKWSRIPSTINSLGVLPLHKIQVNPVAMTAEAGDFRHEPAENQTRLAFWPSLNTAG